MENKKYKETLDLVRSMVANGHITQEIAEKYFPELKDSEDERVRESLYGFVLNTLTCEWDDYDITKEDCLDWLEKQGEQKPVKLPAFKIGDTITDGNSVLTIVDIKDEHYIIDDGDKLCFYVAHRYYTPYKKQKPAWSEEDEKKLNYLIAFLQNSTMTNNALSATNEGIEEWLKSLKDRILPQNTWKPSDKQMEALKEACDEHWEPDGLDPLYMLWEQLKKLREE